MRRGGAGSWKGNKFNFSIVLEEEEVECLVKRREFWRVKDKGRGMTIIELRFNLNSF